MKELSLHILDIVQNSTNAKATDISIEIFEDLPGNLMQVIIQDNGCGIKQEVLATITDPFSTSRTTRRVGLGLSLLKAAAEQCNGSMTIQSTEGQGTTVSATFEHDHIDRMPLGDMVSTIISIIIGNPEVDFCYRHRVNDHTFELDTKVIKRELGEVSISHISVVNFLTEYLQSNLESLYREARL